MPSPRPLALHWKILIGLVLGVAVGLAINTLWTAQTWASLGVNDAARFLAPNAVPGVATGEALAAGVDPASLTPEQLVTQAPNLEAGPLAAAARFARRMTAFVGDLFMRGLRFIAVPIVLFSLIAGVASVGDPRKLGRIGLKTMGLYLATTAAAITLGLVLAHIVRPGEGIPDDVRSTLMASESANAQSRIAAAEAQRARGPWAMALDMFPANPFESMARGDTLQVVVAAVFIGIALTLIKKELAEPVVRLCTGLTEVMIKIVEMVLVLAPYAVFALIVGVVAQLGLPVLEALAKYAGVLVGGLALQALVVYPALIGLTRTRVGYGPFFHAVSPAMLMAFSSASSSATMPVTLECCEHRLGCSNRVTSFVVPTGATINMDGTAMYMGVASVFIAQLFGIPLTMGDNITIVLTATLASIGTAAVPGAGVVMLVIVLNAVGLPLEGIAVILGIDRLMDMCRTCVNVTGDCAVCAIVASSEGELERPGPRTGPAAGA